MNRVYLKITGVCASRFLRQILGCAYTICWHGQIPLLLLLLLLFPPFPVFSHQSELMVFHWSLCDSKSPQVFRTLSILTDLNNVVVWIVPTRPFISKCSSRFNYPSVTVPRVPVTIGINVSFMFHSFFFLFPLQGQGIYPSFYFLSILLYSQPGQQSAQFWKFSFIIIIII